MNSEATAIVLATFLGPIAAIMIARWRDKVSEVRQRRFKIFRTLLATRKQHINVDHVSALNLIEIDFYGEREIEEAWKAYHRHLSSAPIGRQMTDSENRIFEASRIDLLAKLIYSIAMLLGFKMGEIDIKNGGYAPDGWRYRDDRLGKI